MWNLLFPSCASRVHELFFLFYYLLLTHLVVLVPSMCSVLLESGLNHSKCEACHSPTCCRVSYFIFVTCYWLICLSLLCLCAHFDQNLSKCEPFWFCFLVFMPLFYSNSAHSGWSSCHLTIWLIVWLRKKLVAQIYKKISGETYSQEICWWLVIVMVIYICILVIIIILLLFFWEGTISLI